MNPLIKLFAVLLCLSTFASVTAQSSIGLRFGLNSSNVNFDIGNETFDPKARSGFALGLVTEFGGAGLFAFQPELLYTQYGYTIEESVLGQDLKGDIRYSYIQVPLLLKLKLGPEAVKINANVGPHIGFGIGDIRNEFEVLGTKDEDTSSWEDEGLSKFDFGLTGGLGISIGAGPGYLGLDARYQLGLANLIDEPSDDDQITNRNLQLSLSYLVPFGR